MVKRDHVYRSVRAAVVTLLLCVTGCSSGSTPPPPLPAGALPPGTMDVSVNGQPAARHHGLACTHIMAFTAATAGEGGSTVRAVVKGGDELNVVSVQLTDIGDFTGSYMPHLQGTADARLVGTSTFVV